MHEVRRNAMRFAHLLLACFFVWPATQCVAAESAQPRSQCDPYYPGLDSPKLTTPQWVGDQDVEAVVILSIDDMRDSGKYEAYLRPILDRLKQIDGRAPVSIFTNSIEPTDPQLQQWLREGLSLEVHTVDHPCPLLKDGDFAKAKSTYDRCVDLMASIPNNNPVAFRMPCCDSLNTPSPRFWTEIFAKSTAQDRFLQIDSSVFNIFTADDTDLPRNVVINEIGKSRMRHYVPFQSFVNTIENYPYPYIIGDACWEFPCVVPSDWEAQHVQEPNNPDTVRDLKRALDATVAKQGVMPIVFHPHGWIRNDQLVDLIDYAVTTYGKKVKFLTFAEALERINDHLLGGVPLRTKGGNEHAVRLVDLNADGFVDLVRRDGDSVLTRIWNPDARRFDDGRSKMNFAQPTFFLANNEVRLVDYRNAASTIYHRDGVHWKPTGPALMTDNPFDTAGQLECHDIDGDGTDEGLLTSGGETKVLRWQKYAFVPEWYKFPAGAIASAGGDAGVRLVDLNADGKLDIVKSDGRVYGVWLFTDNTKGWEAVRTGEPTDAGAIPTLARPDGTNNGGWFHSDHLWVQNEFTARKPDLVDRMSFTELTREPEVTEEFPLGRAKDLAQSVETFQLSKGARLEVAAAEPEIVDPVAFDWGPDGRLWVVEMSDYPNGADWHGPGDEKNQPGGRIKLLEDRDNDGRFETAHLFLDGLSVPTGVKAWRNGAIVTCAPEIIYVEDTVGDHRADVRKVLYTGLREGNQQHRVNGLRWGLDHSLHLANGDSGGVVSSTKTGDKVDIRGRDFRIQPDLGTVELTSGQTQFGRNRDSVGNWFGGNNSNPVWHYVLDEKYMRRNPHFRAPSARRQISEQPGPAPVFPTSQTLERFNDFDRANRFTSACSPEIVDDQMVYICEPVHNLVHRSELRRDGSSFVAARLKDEQESEFMTSTDNWFRPVMVRGGPDGAIWIVDMYRMVIEHPEWIPKTWQDRIDHLAGNDKGRIYRVVLPTDGLSGKSGSSKRGGKSQWKHIRSASIGELVTMLEASNRIVRDMAHQELYERNDPASVAPLKQLVARDKQNPAAKRLLHHFDAFEVDAIETPHDLKLIEGRLSTSAELRERLFARTRQSLPDLPFRLQLAYTLGEINDPESAPAVGAALAKIAVESLDDRYVRAAVMSSVDASNVVHVMRHFMAQTAGLNPDARRKANDFVADLLESAVGFRSREAVAHFSRSVNRNAASISMLATTVSRLLKAIDRSGKPLNQFVDGETRASLVQLSKSASTVASNDRLDVETRLTALRLFGQFSELEQTEQKAIAELLSPRQPQQLQHRAIELLASASDETSAQSAGVVLSRWNSLTPAIRDTVLAESRERSAWTSAVLDRLDAGSVLPVQIGIRHRQWLLDHDDKSIRLRAKRHFGEIAGDRQSVVESHSQKMLPLTADVANGRAVFRKQCTACHRLEGEGNAIGPDLAAISDRSLPAMTVAILDPNRAVEDKYLGYTVVTKSGLAHRGMLAEESATALTVATVEGKQQSVLRSEIEELVATGKSLMPEGLEQTLSPQQLRDVVGYVQSVSVPRKQFVGNQPRVAPVRDDGSIRLFAMHAEIYGPGMVFEEKYRNLGFWNSSSDRAVWTIDAPEAAEYELQLDYACPPQPNRNRFRILVNGQVLGGEVESTGSWDAYRGMTVGKVRLPDEPVQLTIQSEGPIGGYLMDLRTIRLYPE